MEENTENLTKRLSFQRQNQLLDYTEAMTLIEKWGKIFDDSRDQEMNEMVGSWFARKQLGLALIKHWHLFKEHTRERNRMYTVCVSYTHISPDLCEHFGCSGFLTILFDELKNFKDKSGDLSELERLLTLIYNCSKNPLNVKFFREQNVMETVFGFTSANAPTIQMLASLTFLYVCSDDIDPAIQVDDRVIDNIAMHLRASMESDDHLSDGWSTEELVSAIKHIACTDINSYKVLRTDIVELVKDVMIGGNEKERMVSTDALWMLSYNKAFKKCFIDSEEGYEGALHLSEETSSSLEALPGITWNLKEKDSRTFTPQESRKRIMISYQCDFQVIVERIYEELKGLGYDVWMDIHNATTSLLESMAKAVEESDIMVVCMSQSYKNSPNCRAETSCAFNLKKKIIPLKMETDYKPDGWLGIAVAGLRYINFSNRETQGASFQKSISKLQRDIENIRNNKQ